MNTQYLIPEGFSVDPVNGLCYRVDDSGIENGSQVWYITWFDPQTQEFSQVKYAGEAPPISTIATSESGRPVSQQPASGPPVHQPPTVKKAGSKKPLIIIISVALIAVLGAGGWWLWNSGLLDDLVPAVSRTTADKVDTGDPVAKAEEESAQESGPEAEESEAGQEAAPETDESEAGQENGPGTEEDEADEEFLAKTDETTANAENNVSVSDGVIAGNPQMEGAGFDLPEEAAEAYLTALKKADVKEMIEAFAIESYVDHYDFQAQLERINGYYLNADQGLPAENEFVASLNLYQRIGDLTTGMRYQYLTIFADHLKVLQGEADTFSAESDIAELATLLGNQANIEALQALTIKEFIPPEDMAEMYLNDNIQENMRKRMIPFGADEMTDIVVRADIVGQDYLFLFDAVRYGDKWYLHSFGGTIGTLLGLSPYAGGVALE